MNICYLPKIQAPNDNASVLTKVNKWNEKIDMISDKLVAEKTLNTIAALVNQVVQIYKNANIIGYISTDSYKDYKQILENYAKNSDKIDFKMLFPHEVEEDYAEYSDEESSTEECFNFEVEKQVFKEIVSDLCLLI